MADYYPRKDSRGNFRPNDSRPAAFRLDEFYLGAPANNAESQPTGYYGQRGYGEPSAEIRRAPGGRGAGYPASARRDAADRAAIRRNQELIRIYRLRKAEERRRAEVRKKTAIWLLVIACLLSSAVYAVYRTVMDKINFVDDSTQSGVELSDEELLKLGSLFSSSMIPSDFELPSEVIMSTNDIDIILLIGCDSRLGIGEPSRSDTMMLAAVDRVHKKIKLVSVMRDLYVSMPEYFTHKINTAYFYDSAHRNMDLRVTRETLRRYLGVSVDKFVVVDFNAFKDAIDALGGVSMEVNAAEARSMGEVLYPRFRAGAGTYKMCGEEALTYARMRYVGNADFERTSRQRRMISQIITQLGDASYYRMAVVAMKILPGITTNMSEAEIMGYITEAPELTQYLVKQLSIPIKGSWRGDEAEIEGYKLSVLMADFEFNAAALKAFIFDDEMKYADGASAVNVDIPTLSSETETTTSTAALHTTATSTVTTTGTIPTTSTQNQETE